MLTLEVTEFGPAYQCENVTGPISGPDWDHHVSGLFVFELGNSDEK